MGFFSRPAIPDAVEMTLAGRPVTVSVKKSQRARQYRLAISARGEPVLTVPANGRWAQAKSFLFRHEGWLAARLDRAGALVPFAPGAVIPLRGVDHRLVSLSASRGVVAVHSGPGGAELHVPGGPAHLPRRLGDWLKSEARRDLEPACKRHADTLEVEIAAIRLRAQTTRWGSCSSARVLNFNWRLILAPPFVLDYVAAHEVAHLVEMNHSPAFWRTVERALPEMAEGKAWLKANGRRLLAIG